MANAKADFNNPEFTGLAERCWTVFASTYNPLRIIDMCREVQALEEKYKQLERYIWSKHAGLAEAMMSSELPQKEMGVYEEIENNILGYLIEGDSNGETK